MFHGKFTISMAMFNSYVKLPEGMSIQWDMITMVYEYWDMDNDYDCNGIIPKSSLEIRTKSWSSINGMIWGTPMTLETSKWSRVWTCSDIFSGQSVYKVCTKCVQSVFWTWRCEHGYWVFGWCWEKHLRYLRVENKWYRKFETPCFPCDIDEVLLNKYNIIPGWVGHFCHMDPSETGA